MSERGGRERGDGRAMMLLKKEVGGGGRTQKVKGGKARGEE